MRTILIVEDNQEGGGKGKYMQLREVFEWLDGEGLESLILQFKEVVRTKGWNLSEPSQSRGLCGTVSEIFAMFLVEHGYSPQAARLDWDGFVATPTHYAVELDGKIYDWTASQFLGEVGSVPEVFESVDAWAVKLGSRVKSIKPPTARVLPIAC